MGAMYTSQQLKNDGEAGIKVGLSRGEWSSESSRIFKRESLRGILEGNVYRAFTHGVLSSQVSSILELDFCNKLLW